MPSNFMLGRTLAGLVRPVLLNLSGGVEIAGLDHWEGEIGETLQNLSLPAGNSLVDGAIVPAGECWVVTNVIMKYVGTVATVHLYNIYIHGAYQPVLWTKEVIVSGETYDRQAHWVMAAGGKLRCYIFNATLNDDIYFQYWGYKFTP